MKDNKGRVLQTGDVVLIPAVITSPALEDDSAQVTLQTLHGRPMDDVKEQIFAINTGVMFRANDGDDNDLEEITPAPELEEPGDDPLEDE